MGVAPIEDPEVVILATLYNPTGEGGHQGGGVAAPLGGQIFSEILPYLEVNQGNEEEVEKIEQVEVPDVTKKSLKEAEQILKEAGFTAVIENESQDLDKENTFVSEQTPKPGIVVSNTSKIYLKY